MTPSTRGRKFDLGRTITATYFGLRWSLVAIAAAFPFVLWWGGSIFHDGLPQQNSLSAYYHTPMRDWFVGVLFAVAASLYVYKGLSDREDYLLNGAAVLAVGTAVNPPGWLPSWWFLPALFSPHGICAVSFFVAIALACLLCQDDSLKLDLVSQGEATRLRKEYTAIGVLLVALPAGAAFFQEHRIFWVEAAAIWVFGFYWYTKTGELKKAIDRESASPRRPDASRATA